MPVDLLGVEPRIWGDLETVQAVSLFAAGLSALAALAGRLPVLPAALLAGSLAGYALLDVAGQPVRRVVPRIMRHGLTSRAAAENLDAALWLGVPQEDMLRHIPALVHCLSGRMRLGRYGGCGRRT